MEIEKFDPTEAELRAIVAVTEKITADDLEDPKQLAVVRENRIALKNARVRIEKTGKALRDDALKFQRAVIAKEKELVAIIEPEEDRLRAIEQAAKDLAERKKRVAILPERHARLASIGDSVTVTDDQLLDMDGPAFEGYFNQRQAAKIEADRIELEARERAVKEAEDAAKRAAELEAAKERARQEERERAEREAEREAERAADEERRLQSEQRYQAFLAESGYSEETKAD